MSFIRKHPVPTKRVTV